MKKRIYYHDTDCGGVVYHGNYLKYLEEARTEYMERRGLSVKKLLDEGIGFVVYQMEMTYKLPAAYNDVLDIETKVTHMTPVRTMFEYVLRNQKGDITTLAKTTLVSINTRGEPHPLPKELREKMLGPALA